MWINDGSLAEQSYARAFAWSNESTFQKRGYIQYIYILRCSLHDTAKRLSITSLTRLLRLQTKIQSSIARHFSPKVPTTKRQSLTSLCATPTGTNFFFVVVWLWLYHMWFCYKQKTEKKYEVSHTFRKNLICHCYWQFPPSFKRRHK